MTAIKLFSTTIKGYIDITGNTLGLAGSNTNIIGGVRNFTTSSGGTTTNYANNSSSAQLNIPAGGTVINAQLFWSAVYKDTATTGIDLSSVINNSINFITPKGVTNNIIRDINSAQTINRGSAYYSNSADVTDLVKDGGSGTYTVGNVPGILTGTFTSGDIDNFYIGWTLIVAIGDQSQTYKNMTIWSMCDADGTSVSVTGFATGPTGPFQGRLFISAGCGNSSLTGDSLQFGTSGATLSNLSTTSHPSTNFFCGIISDRLGALNTLGTFGNANNTAGSIPTSGNRSMYDITGADASSTLVANQTSAVIRVNSTGDGVIANSLGLEVTMTNVANLSQGFNCSVDKANAVVGDTLKYTLTLKNTGVTIANNVVLVNTIPDATSFVTNSLVLNGTTINGASPLPSNGYSLGSMAVNAVNTISYSVVVTTLPTNNTALNQVGVGYSFVPATGLWIPVFDISNVASTTVTGPIKGTKYVDKSYSDVGNILTYTIAYSNTGTSTGNNVVFLDTVPTGTSFVSDSFSVNGVIQTGINLNTSIPLATIPIGTTTLSYKVLVNTIPTINPFNNSANLIYQYTVLQPNSYIGVDNTNLVTTKVNTAFLNSTKYVDKTYVYIGETITYTILLNTSGNISANNVVLKDTIPTGTTFVTNSLLLNGVTQNGTTPNGGYIIGTIAQGLVTTVQFKVTVTTMPTTSQIQNSAVATYKYTVDPSVPNGISTSYNTNMVINEVKGANLLNATKVVSDAYADANDILTYTLVIPNTGNVDASNVIVTDTIPVGVSFITNSIKVNGVQTGETPSRINVGTIPVGTSATITFNVQLNS